MHFSIKRHTLTLSPLIKNYYLFGQKIVINDETGPYSVSEDVEKLPPTLRNSSAPNITFDFEPVLSIANGTPVVEGCGLKP